MFAERDNFLSTKISSLLNQYLYALGATAITTLVLVSLRGVLSSATIALVFLLPVGLSTTRWGLGPGLASGLGAFVSINFFFISPYYTLQVHQTQDLMVLAIFLVIAVVLNQMMGRVRLSLGEARARERETAWLYELSIALGRLTDDTAIARTLAEQVLVTFQAECVQVSLEPAQGLKPVVVCVPERLASSGEAPVRSGSEGGSPAGNSLVESKPTRLVALQTARGLLGEIGLWRSEPPVAPAEERLLSIFASQAALTLDRARLAQAETRARVLEESDRLKSALLSSVSHELRTPLATIKASVTSLGHDDLGLDDEARRELLVAIEEETDHLNHLVGNLLDMSRIEAGAIEPQRKWNILAEIAAGVVRRMSAANRGRTIDNRISYDLPLVPVDWVQMDRVFTNLISNSLKYSPESTPVILQAGVLDSHSLLVEVINQGPHVPAEHLERIFDKFTRVTAAERITGTGLGLSICKGFVEAHGGRIWAENLPSGFAFKFTLPLSWQGSPPSPPPE